MPEFDPGHGYDDEPRYSDDGGCLGFTSAENLRDKALFLFGRFLEKISQREVPAEITPAVQQYLSVAEVGLILQDYAKEVPDGFVIGGESKEELDRALRELMASLIERILSNVLAQGVKDGFLDCTFAAAMNDFCFFVTEKGMKLSDEYARHSRPISD